MVSEHQIPIEGTLKALVKNDKAELLESLIDSNDIDVTDGEIVDHGNPVPAMKIAIDKSAIKCVFALKSKGVKLTETVSMMKLFKDNVLKTNTNFDILTKIFPNEPREIDTKDECGQTMLHIAAKSGNIDACKFLFHRYHPKIDSEDSDCNTSLHRAAAAISGDPAACIKLLLEKGSNLEAENNVGRTVLHVAAEAGNKIACGILLSDNPKLDAKDRNGNSSLHLAATASSGDPLACMGLLLQKGANIEAENDSGLTALQVAAEAQQADNAKFLISRNAQLNRRDKRGVSLVQTISSKVPRAMDEFTRRLDSGVKKVGDVISLDFSKISTKDDTSLFKDLVKSHGSEMLKDQILHPLCHAYLYKKYSQLKWFYILIIGLSHFVFSAIYSIYSVLLFQYICSPDNNFDQGADRWNWNTIIECNTNDKLEGLMFVLWILITIFAVVYIMREVCKQWFLKRNTHVVVDGELMDSFLNWDTLRNFLILISIILNIYAGPPTASGESKKMEIAVWRYHVASLTCVLLWLEMMMLVGRVPRFGKYVQMAETVTFKMMEFSVPFLCLAIGFVMAFTILFQEQEVFQLKQFPGSLVSVRKLFNKIFS